MVTHLAAEEALGLTVTFPPGVMKFVAVEIVLLRGVTAPTLVALYTACWKLTQWGLCGVT